MGLWIDLRWIRNFNEFISDDMLDLLSQEFKDIILTSARKLANGGVESHITCSSATDCRGARNGTSCMCSHSIHVKYTHLQIYIVSSSINIFVTRDSPRNYRLTDSSVHRQTWTDTHVGWKYNNAYCKKRYLERSGTWKVCLRTLIRNVIRKESEITIHYENRSRCNSWPVTPCSIGIRS